MIIKINDSLVEVSQKKKEKQLTNPIFRFQRLTPSSRLLSTQFNITLEEGVRH